MISSLESVSVDQAAGLKMLCPNKVLSNAAVRELPLAWVVVCERSEASSNMQALFKGVWTGLHRNGKPV